MPQSVEEFQQFHSHNDEAQTDLAPMIRKIMNETSPDECDDRVVKFFESFDRMQLQQVAKKNLELQ